MTVPRFIEDVEKAGYIPILIGRVSSSGQRKGLPTQMKFMREAVKKRFNFKKRPIELSIVQTGKAGELESLAQVEKIVEKNPKKKFVGIFRDVSRIARDTENGLALQRRLSALGVPIIALNMSTLLGKKPLGDRSADLLFQIQLGISQTGKDSEQEAQQTGVGEAAEVGLKFGVPQTLYLKKVKEGMPSIHRRIWLSIPAIEAKAQSVTGMARQLRFISTGAKTRGQVNKSQPEKILKFLRKLLEEGGEAKVQEYLEVIDAILAAERKVGERTSKSKTRKQRALHRVTVAYLQEPMNWPRPDTVGNPAIAEFTGEIGPGTIEDAIKNPGPYQPSK